MLNLCCSVPHRAHTISYVGTVRLFALFGRVPCEEPTLLRRCHIYIYINIYIYIYIYVFIYTYMYVYIWRRLILRGTGALGKADYLHNQTGSPKEVLKNRKGGAFFFIYTCSNFSWSPAAHICFCILCYT